MNKKIILNEDNNSLRGFVDPFINVYRVAKTSAKGIASSAGTFLAILNPFLLSPQKIDNLVNNYNHRIRGIRSELSGLNRQVVSSLGPDAAVIAFLAAPAAFVTFYASKEFLTTSKEILLDATGIGDWVSDMWGLGWNKFKESYSEKNYYNRNNRNDDDGLRTLAMQGPLGDLLRIFFYENQKKEGAILNESTVNNKKEFYHRLFDEMKTLGVNDKSQIKFNEFKEIKETQIKEFLDLAQNYEKISKIIIDSQDFNSFMKNIEDMPEIKKNIEEFIEKNKKDFDSTFKFFKNNFKPNDSLLEKTAKLILSDIPPIEILNKMPKNDNVVFLLKIHQILQKYL